MGEPMQEHASSPGIKRKRSPHSELPESTAPSSKTNRGQAHTQINYLAREYDDELPIITSRDPLGDILRLLNDYHGVIDRQESLASNMGVRPLGLVLMKRFERLFEGPPKILKGPSKDGANVSWLDVVEFARNKPEQFTLGQMSDGHRVCQFYTKQCRVQISEEDFLLIQSGAPQKLIPPQPIIEDEEKELGSLEIITKAVDAISLVSEQVCTRAKQLSHKLKSRKQAIMERRAAHTSISSAQALRESSPSNVALINGGTSKQSSSQSPPVNTGFVPVNASRNAATDKEMQRIEHNLKESVGVSASTHNELLQKFATIAGQSVREISSSNNLSGHDSSLPPAARLPAAPGSKGKGRQSQHHPGGSDQASTLLNQGASLARTTGQAQGKPTTGSLGGRSTNADRDDGGPFKAEMVARLDKLPKGERIIPPCDRCRRLHMDCLKNLTACIGCTRKHAKCGWKEVREEELKSSGPLIAGGGGGSSSSPGRAAAVAAGNSPEASGSGIALSDTSRSQLERDRALGPYTSCSSTHPSHLLPQSQHPQTQLQESHHFRTASSDSTGFPTSHRDISSNNYFGPIQPAGSGTDKNSPFERPPTGLSSSVSATASYRETPSSNNDSSRHPIHHHSHTYANAPRSSSSFPQLSSGTGPSLGPTLPAPVSASANWNVSGKSSVEGGGFAAIDSRQSQTHSPGQRDGKNSPSVAGSIAQ